MDETAPTSGSSANVMLRVLVIQVGLGVVLATVFWGVDGLVSGYSALLGSLTCAVPNAYLALRLAVPRREPGADALIRAAYIGELGKVVLTVLMFGTVFALVRPLAAAPLFIGFIAAQLATFAGFLMRDSEQQEARQTNGE